MVCTERIAGTRYRVWIVRYEGLPPANWHDVPTGAVAVEPAEDGAMTRRQAHRYVEAFNRAAIGARRRVWAAAVPVTIRYNGDPQPGGELAERRIKKARYRPVRSRPVTGFHRGSLPDASCGGPVKTPSARQPHHTP